VESLSNSHYMVLARTCLATCWLSGFQLLITVAREAAGYTD
jgi:hypothetical protein